MHGHWFTGSASTPGSGTTLVDSGPLAAGDYYVQATVYGDADAVYELQHRNSLNDTSRHAQPRPLKAAVGVDDFVVSTRIPVQHGERIRLHFTTGASGAYVGSLFMQRAV